MIATGRAVDDRNVASAIVKENDLLPDTQMVFHPLDERRRKIPLHFHALLGSGDIDQLDIREGHPAVALIEFRIAMYTLLRFIKRVKRGGGATQNHLAVFCPLRDHYSRRACMISGCRIVLLKGTVVFFIYDNKTQFLKRKENP